MEEVGELKRLILFLLIALVLGISAGCAGNKSGEELNEKNSLNVSNSQEISQNEQKINESRSAGDNSKRFNPVRVKDDFGYEVVINKTPERIVSLAPSNTEILFALGLGNKIVGVTDYCNYPEEAKKKQKVGGYSTVNIERVLALNPDLVVAAYGNGKETIDILREYGLTVIALNPKNLSDVMRDIELLGKVTGAEENATRLVDMMEHRIDEVKRNASNFSLRPKVAHVLWHDPIWVSGKNTFIDELISIAGGENAFGDLEGWKIVSIEDFLARNPDIIVVNSGTGMGGGKDILYDWTIRELKDVEAVKEGRVYLIDSDIISRPSYRLVYALEELSEIISEFSSSKSR